MSAATRALPDHELYRKVVLAHARSPHNFGPLTDATHTADGINPLCGDKLSLYLTVGPDDRIETARFEGTGCAISLASSSLLTDTVTGQRTDEALTLHALVMQLLETPSENEIVGANDDALRPLLALSGVRQFPSRIKCATLAWQALASAIRNNSKAPVSTE